ncbi:glutathione S-transferase family protein [Parahaliea mediterranea]|uniref:Glutathione S-transferase N-terminal domain-containing protein n=1 Tax=Parahaliea mediterranea TaxID=651086 RepID=A0A939DEA8_9GAMM|nr:glutathione S-transferase N-terminal domain-containing protein [Parahaliea mediterranea]MBN7796658.1 glutathione S-transferase N-terminal domain-containing protein [Parahaliea mediterranea]
MKLFTFDPAPNPKRLQLFIDYKGIHLDTTQVDLMAKEQLEPEFRAVNPAGTVPALVLDDGTVLTEVIGACVYLEEQYPEKPLLGTTALERAQVFSWDHRLFNTCLGAVAEILRNGNPAFAGRALPGPLEIPQIPELVERGRLRLAPAFKAADAALADSPFLAGDSVSLADIDLLVSIEFAGWVKESVPEGCDNIQAWLPRAKEALGIS